MDILLLMHHTNRLSLSIDYKCFHRLGPSLNILRSVTNVIIKQQNMAIARVIRNMFMKVFNMPVTNVTIKQVISRAINNLFMKVLSMPLTSVIINLKNMVISRVINNLFMKV